MFLGFFSGQGLCLLKPQYSINFMLMRFFKIDNTICVIYFRNKYYVCNKFINVNMHLCLKIFDKNKKQFVKNTFNKAIRM